MDETNIPIPDKSGRPAIDQSRGVRVDRSPHPLASSFQAPMVDKTVMTVSTKKAKNTDNHWPVSKHFDQFNGDFTGSFQVRRILWI